jgi:CRP/FNR family transcriptional regulator
MKNCTHLGNCTICCCDKTPALFNKLNPQEFESLHADRREVTFKAGEVIFKQGTALTHFACFRDGMAKVYFERPTGSNILINIVKNGGLCGSMGLFTDNIHHLTVQALTDVKLCLISSNDIGILLQRNTEMAVELISIKNENIIHLTNKLANLTFKSMAGRVAEVLLYLRNEIYQNNTFNLSLSRQDLADLAAMTKESFIRSLKEMKDSGIVRVNHNLIEIINLTELQKISQN